MNTDKPQHTPVAESDLQSLLVLYQVTVADIAFFKQQQWMVMNYAVGLEGALITVIYTLLNAPPDVIGIWALILLACAIQGCAFLALTRLKNSIKGRRDRLEQTRELLGRVFVQAWAIAKEPDDFYFLFISVLLAIWCVTLWLIIARA